MFPIKVLFETFYSQHHPPLRAQDCLLSRLPNYEVYAIANEPPTVNCTNIAFSLNADASQTTRVLNFEISFSKASFEISGLLPPLFIL